MEHQEDTKIQPPNSFSIKRFSACVLLSACGFQYRDRDYQSSLNLGFASLYIIQASSCLYIFHFPSLGYFEMDALLSRVSFSGCFIKGLYTVCGTNCPQERRDSVMRSKLTRKWEIK